MRARDDTPRPGATAPYRVAFRPTMTHRESLVYALLMLVGTLLSVRYFAWWFQLGHIPGDLALEDESPLFGTSWAVLAPFVLLTIVEMVRILSSFFLWMLALFMEDPLPMKPERGLKIAVLTTIVPSKEPIEIVERMLRAAKRIRYDGRVDLWLLDEGDDDNVKAMCKRLGVHHFTRKGIEKWNQDSGPFRAMTKAGNHNAWRDAHEEGYDLVGQMDPDHVPYDTFLERTIGYFRDPDVGYVVSPQIYGNYHESWIARGADEQAFIFHGIVQRGANGLSMPILIGTNHIYRPAAMQSIGGYMGIIVEDHATGEAMKGEINPATGERWKGIYVPEAVSVGDGPITWTDYFSQQMRWAYGMFEIIRDHDWRLLRRLGVLQAFGYLMVQSYYGFAAFVFIGGNFLTFLYLAAGLSAADMDLGTWWLLWLPQFIWTFVVWYWLQRFYLYESDRGWTLRGFTLTFASLPVFAQAAFASFTGRSLPYVVTAKGASRAADTIGVFKLHIIIALVGTAVLVASFLLGNNAPQLRVWAFVTILLTGGFPVAFLISRAWTSLRGDDTAAETDRQLDRLDRLKQPASALQRPLPQPAMAQPTRGLQPAFASAGAGQSSVNALNASELSDNRMQMSTAAGELMAWPRNAGRVEAPAANPQARPPKAPSHSREISYQQELAAAKAAPADSRLPAVYGLLPASAILVLALAILGDVFLSGYPRGFDIFAHLPKVESLSNNLNVFTTDWYDAWYGGYHQWSLNPWFSYLPAGLLAALTGDVLQAAKIQIFTLIVLSGVGTYLACRELLGQRDGQPSSRAASFAGAIAFAFSPAILSSIFSRGEFSDYTAMALAPFSFWILFKASHTRSLVIWTVYGVTLGLSFLIHVNVFVFVFGGGLIWLVAAGRAGPRNLAGMVVATLVTAGLSVFWVVPFLELSPQVGDLESRLGSNLHFELNSLFERSPNTGISWYVGMTTILIAGAGLFFSGARRLVAPFAAMAVIGVVIGTAWLSALQDDLPFLNEVDADNAIVMIVLGLAFSVALTTDEIIGRRRGLPMLAHFVGLSVAAVLFFDVSIASTFARSDAEISPDLIRAAEYVEGQDLEPLERVTTISTPENFAQLAYIPSLTGLSITAGYDYQSAATGGINYYATNIAIDEGRADETLYILSQFNTRYLIVDALGRPHAAEAFLEHEALVEREQFGRWIVLERIDKPSALRSIEGANIAPMDYEIQRHDDGSTELHLTATEATTVLTPISWSPEWEVTVDGQRIEHEEFTGGAIRGGFLAFPVEAGEHDVQIELGQVDHAAEARSFSAVFALAVGAFLVVAFVRRFRRDSPHP